MAAVTQSSSDKSHASSSSLEVHSEGMLTVVSTVPLNDPGRICKLTPLDRAMGQHNLHVIFYYRSGSLEFEPLRVGLGETLMVYPNVAGRLAKDDGDGNWEVKFTDVGVRVYLAKVGCSVDEWLRSAGRDDEVHLTVRDEFPDDPRYWSPYRIQITDFEGGGTAIALSCPHLLADPITATIFIKSWTETYRGDAIVHPPFLHPIALSDPPKTNTTGTASAPYYAVKSERSIPETSVRMASATFSFSDSTVKQCLSETCSAVLDATPFDLLAALFWMRIARLKTVTQDSEHNITICLDMRKRLRAPLPRGYFGNALYFKDLTLADENINNSKNLGHVAEVVHSFVTGVTEEEFVSAVNWLQSRKDAQGNSAAPFRMYGPELTCVNMEHMIGPVGKYYASESHPLMYMASFDKDQKPTHVSYQVENAEGEGLILVMPSPEEGFARRVSVTLPEEEMKKLLEDEVILRLEPTLLLSGRG